jgi:ATP-binding cassette subfamily G (WHITE) protein 2 (PDR)
MSLVGNFTANDDKQAALTSSPYRHQRDHDSAQRRLAQDGASDDATLDGTAGADDEDSEARRGQDIHNLARTMSRRSSVHAGAGADNDPLNPIEGSIFDPWSDKFDSKAWSKAVVQLASQDGDAPPRRQAGIAFDNLNVHGFGSDTEYQTTVGNGPLKAWGALKGLISSKSKRKVQILQGVDGVLHPGEMLVVLGPPGRCALALKPLF